MVKYQPLIYQIFQILSFFRTFDTKANQRSYLINDLSLYKRLKSQIQIDTVIEKNVDRIKEILDPKLEHNQHLDDLIKFVSNKIPFTSIGIKTIKKYGAAEPKIYEFFPFISDILIKLIKTKK